MNPPGRAAALVALACLTARRRLGPEAAGLSAVAGQRCLYNVWSAVSVDHLERLLAELRFVADAVR